jgi:predicted unusual protein kinase regulating ubiquinone biosynthesis (AarF/ABC1/UbiB family)/ribosomal protein L7/L12
MRMDEIRIQVASRLAAREATPPSSLLGRPARLLAGVTQASARSLARSLRRRVGRPRPDVAPEQALVGSLGRLKGVTMKLGQLFGYIDVGLPPRLRSALSALHTHAQPLPFAAIRATVVAELGAAGQELVRTLEPAPLCSGSLGQVHRATLPDGTRVAVKVLHPEIAKIVTRDFAPAMLGGRLGGWVYRRGRGLVRDLRARVLEECDYTLEARRQERFAQLFAQHATIVVPAIQPRWCSARVLTSALVDGVHLDDFLAADPSQAARNRAGEALFDFYVGALFRQGLYNCDPHPGNYLFLQDGRVALVDFGCVAEFEAGFTTRLATLTRALLADDADAIARAAAAVGIVSTEHAIDLEAVRWLLRVAYGPLLHDEVTAFDVGAGIKLREVLRRWRRARGIALSAELVFLLRTFFGVAAVLGRLGARANWQRRLEDLVAPPPLETAATPAPASVPAPPPAPAIDLGRYDVVLVAGGDDVIALVRELRELTNLDLRDVKQLIDYAPRPIQRGLSRADAEQLRERLESRGAHVRLERVDPS